MKQSVRSRVSVAAVLLALTIVSGCGGDVSTNADGTASTNTSANTPRTPTTGLEALSGQIAYKRATGGVSAVYVINADGTDEHELYAEGSEWPHWSPDGTVVSVFCCGSGAAAHFVDAAGGRFHELWSPDPALEMHCGIWSPDGKSVACESYGVSDKRQNGAYSIRVSDGMGLTRITSTGARPGASDAPNDYSPDGKKLVLVRDLPEPQLIIAALGSARVTTIPTPGLSLEYGFTTARWSPDGSRILFFAHAPNRRRGFWTVRPNGTGLEPLPVGPCGRPIADAKGVDCRDPAWSPDGRNWAFVMSGTGDDLYIATADGTDLHQLTTTGDASEPDWGPRD